MGKSADTAAATGGALGVVLLGLLYTSHGCARRPTARGAIRIAVHSEPLSLDPHQRNEVLTLSILRNVFDGLTSLDPDLRVQPSLATRWETSDDLLWRFFLDPAARFHDGRPVEAEDVVFSLHRVADHPRTDFSGYVVDVQSVRAIDRGVVEIELRRPFVGLPTSLAFVFIVPRSSPDEITDPVGSGPYRLAWSRSGAGVALEPAPTDWRAPRAEHALEFVRVPDPAERVARLLAGRIDVVQDLSPSDVERVQAAACCRVVDRTSILVEHLQLRARDPRFADRRVRRAMDLALDREQLARRAFQGFASPASQMVPPEIFGHDPEIAVRRRDLAMAHRLLAEAGYPDGFSVSLEYRTGRRGEEIARQLEEVGLRVETRASDWPQLYQRLIRGDVGLYYGGNAALTGNAGHLLDNLAHTFDPERGYGRANHNGYSNPDLDTLVEEAAAERNSLQRRSLLQRAMRILIDDLYHLPLVAPADLYGIRQDIDWRPRLDRMLLGRGMQRRPSGT